MRSKKLLLEDKQMSSERKRYIPKKEYIFRGTTTLSKEQRHYPRNNDIIQGTTILFKEQRHYPRNNDIIRGTTTLSEEQRHYSRNNDIIRGTTTLSQEKIQPKKTRHHPKEYIYYPKKINPDEPFYKSLAKEMTSLKTTK